MAIELFMNLISINVNRIHIRFEDDFYTGMSSPYAFGFTINSLNVNSTDKEIKFDNPLDLQYKEFVPDENKNLYLKHILMQDIAMYWNTEAQIYVPHELQNKTVIKDQKIFDYDGIDPEEFRKLMILPFKDIQKQKKRGTMIFEHDERFEYILNPLTIDINMSYYNCKRIEYVFKPLTIDINMSYYRLKDEDVKKHKYHRFSLTALISPVRLSIKPQILDSIKIFMEYVQYQMMMPFLQRYRPRRRPYVVQRGSQRDKDPAVTQVRRQIRKDWFCLPI